MVAVGTPARQEAPSASVWCVRACVVFWRPCSCSEAAQKLLTSCSEAACPTALPVYHMLSLCTPLAAAARSAFCTWASSASSCNRAVRQGAVGRCVCVCGGGGGAGRAMWGRTSPWFSPPWLHHAISIMIYPDPCDPTCWPSCLMAARMPSRRCCSSWVKAPSCHVRRRAPALLGAATALSVVARTRLPGTAACPPAARGAGPIGSPPAVRGRARTWAWPAITTYMQSPAVGGGVWGCWHAGLAPEWWWLHAPGSSPPGGGGGGVCGGSSGQASPALLLPAGGCAACMYACITKHPHCSCSPAASSSNSSEPAGACTYVAVRARRSHTGWGRRLNASSPAGAARVLVLVSTCC
jgi:hypothetical protein